jgi:hypothetical protein
LEGVKSALMTVTMGPSVPATIIVWPSRRLPFWKRFDETVLDEIYG